MSETTASLPTLSYGSMSRDRKRALWWSYFFLIVFAIFFSDTTDLYDGDFAQDKC